MRNEGAPNIFHFEGEDMRSGMLKLFILVSMVFGTTSAFSQMTAGEFIQATEEGDFTMYVEAGSDATAVRHAVVGAYNLGLNITDLVLDTATDLVVLTGNHAEVVRDLVWEVDASIYTVSATTGKDIIILFGATARNTINALKTAYNAVLTGDVKMFVGAAATLALSTIKNVIRFMAQTAVRLAQLTKNVIKAAAHAAFNIMRATFQAAGSLIVKSIERTLGIVQYAAGVLKNIIKRTVSGAIRLVKAAFQAIHKVTAKIFKVVMQGAKLVWDLAVKVVHGVVRFVGRVIRGVASIFHRGAHVAYDVAERFFTFEVKDYAL